MRVNRPAALAIAGVMAMAALAACGSGSTAAAANSGVLNIGMPNGPLTDNNNPFLPSSASSSLGYKFMIYEPLVMLNSAQPSAPGKAWLATKWAWSNNFSSLTATVRDNVKWSDGQALTAADVAYTFDLLKKNATLNTNALPITTTSTSGNTATINFSSSQFVNQYKILTQTFIVPQHIWSKISDPSTDTIKNPVGSGPYTLKSFTSQTVVLNERSTYWQAL
ncbi:MAG TPA: ABC transporter substrate-binding protein, partial [Pseudonocardiaceae bacterium]